MAAAAVEGGSLAQGNQQGLGRGQAAAVEETRDHRAGAEEGDRQGRSSLVRQWPGADAGGRSRSRGVLDGFSPDGGRPRRRSRGGRGAAPLATNRSLVRRRLQGSHGGAVSPLPQGPPLFAAACPLG